ncbi:hypothetical protein ACMUMQ_01885 [Marinomonas sp. 2405UD66-6]
MNLTRPSNISRCTSWTAKSVTSFVPKAAPILSAVVGDVNFTLDS